MLYYDKTIMVLPRNAGILIIKVNRWRYLFLFSSRLLWSRLFI